MARVRVVQLASARGLPLPEYQTKGAAGLDLVAAVAAGAPQTIAPGARALIPTGLEIELPKGYEAQVRPRSGLALKHGLTVLNSPGTIDSDYRGEVKIILINLGTEPFVVARGERIAQLVVAPVTTAKLVPVTTLSVTARGDGGFGSTRLKAEAKKMIPARRGSLKSKSLPGRTGVPKRSAKPR